MNRRKNYETRSSTVRRPLIVKYSDIETTLSDGILRYMSEVIAPDPMHKPLTPRIARVLRILCRLEFVRLNLEIKTIHLHFLSFCFLFLHLLKVRVKRFTCWRINTVSLTKGLSRNSIFASWIWPHIVAFPKRISSFNVRSVPAVPPFSLQRRLVFPKKKKYVPFVLTISCSAFSLLFVREEEKETNA